MKKLYRIMSLALALVLCLSALAGCGGTPPAAPSDSTPAPDNGSTTTPGDTTKPTEPPVDPSTIATFQQSPYIADVMGITAPVEERIPTKDDVMVESVDAAGNPLLVGKYGGDLKRAAGSGNWGAGKPIEEGLFRFNTSAMVEPNVAKGYDVNADSTVYTIYLREGMKWSDGEPFTAEDCVWFYNVVCKNKLDSKGIRSCHKDSEGAEAVVEKVDDYTFTVTFEHPKYDFLEALTVDLKWHYAPKHTFEKMCQLILEGKDDDAIAEAKNICGIEFSDVGGAGKELLYYFWNYPGVPTLNPFVLSTENGKNSIKGEYYEYIRNPYYWKVDTAGNQLPYIDRITYTTVQNPEQSFMLLLDGSVDFDSIGIDSISTALQAEETSNNKINIYEWAGTDWGSVPHQLHLNMAIADANKNALFNNPDFRQALSICVNRDELAGALTNSWVSGGQACPQKGNMGYSEEWAAKWTEYDVAKAKTLLDGCGLVLGSDGFYDFADGSDFELNIISVADNGAADTYALLKTYFDAVGVKTTFRDYDRAYVDNEMLAGNVECTIYPVTGIGDLSIALKPNSMVPGTATNVVWYGNMTEETATGDLLELIKLNKQLSQTGDPDKRMEIALQMLKLHEKNMWVIGYIASDSAFFAVNERIKNFPDGLVWSDIYRDMGIGHCQCWFIEE